MRLLKPSSKNSRHEEELATAALDLMVTLPGEAVENVLGSIFADTRLISNPHESKAPPPFATPFGASVLTCSKRGYGVMFYYTTPKTQNPLSQTLFISEEQSI